MTVPKLYRKPKPITKITESMSELSKLYNLYSTYNSVPVIKLKENFKNTLEDNNIELSKVVNKFKLSRNTAYAYVNAGNKIKPSLELLVRICVEFDVNINEFLVKD